MWGRNSGENRKGFLWGKQQLRESRAAPFNIKTETHQGVGCDSQPTTCPQVRTREYNREGSNPSQLKPNPPTPWASKTLTCKKQGDRKDNFLTQRLPVST